ncbi:MAG: hypothetical protein PHR35_14185, partial [Kiritimatiellae bacterium]|nr:hypothetical protein [Kiritimatiellia bacterium]
MSKSVPVDWSNPYADTRGTWLKGNLHTHSSDGSACGQTPLAEVLKRYARSGHDFLCVSDHMTLTEPRPAAAHGLLLLPGIEWNSHAGEHMGVYTLDRALLRHCVKSSDQSALLSYLSRRDALVVLNHPNWQREPHYSHEQLMRRES